MFFLPIVTEDTIRGKRSCDIFSKLLEERIIFITGKIEDRLSSIVIAQMIFLEYKDPKKDIYLYINSPGGEVNSGLSIYDTMQFISPDINTICVGKCMSMGAILLSSGKKGKRFCLPNSQIMIHQPLSGFHGPATDCDIHVKELLRLKTSINQIVAKNTEKTIEKIEKDTERDLFFSPESALDYGIIDFIITKNKSLK